MMAKYENGKPNKKEVVGASVDFIKEVFKRMGLECKIKRRPWKRCLWGVANYETEREYEVVLNLTYSEERGEQYYFSTPIFTTTYGAFYSKKKFPNGPPIIKSSDLNSYRLCGALGYNYAMLKKVGVTKKMDTGALTVLNALKKVSLDRCDFFLNYIEPTLGLQLIGEELPSDIDYIVLSDVDIQLFYIGIAKTSERAIELKTEFDQMVLYLRQIGVADKIFKKYILRGDMEANLQKKYHILKPC